MSENWTGPLPAASFSSYDEARLEVIRKLAHRLETLTGLLVGILVLGSIIAGAISAGSSSGWEAAIPAVMGGAVTLFFGVFLYSAVRLACNAILFVCEHLAGL